MTGEILGAGKSCRVQCDKGFEEVSGISEYQCSDSGYLINATIACNPITCKLPEVFGKNVVGGDVDPCVPLGSLLGTGECGVKCDDGFVAESGVGSYTCSAAGVLSNGSLKCVKPSDKKTETISETEDLKQEIEFQCKPAIDKEHIQINIKEEERKSSIFGPNSAKFNPYWRSWR